MILTEENDGDDEAFNQDKEGISDKPRQPKRCHV